MHSELWKEAHYQAQFPPYTISHNVYSRVSPAAVFTIKLLLYNTVIELLLFLLLLLTDGWILKAQWIHFETETQLDGVLKCSTDLHSS